MTFTDIIEYIAVFRAVGMIICLIFKIPDGRW